MDNQKKVTAAISVVINYIKTDKTVYRKASSASINRWRIGGRQLQMQLRNQMQAKAFYGWKLR